MNASTPYPTIRIWNVRERGCNVVTANVAITCRRESQPVPIDHSIYEHPRDKRRREQPFYRGIKKWRKKI